MKKYRNNGVIGALLDKSEYKELNEGLEKIKVVEPENAQFVIDGMGVEAKIN